MAQKTVMTTRLQLLFVGLFCFLLGFAMCLFLVYKPPSKEVPVSVTAAATSAPATWTLPATMPGLLRTTLYFPEPREPSTSIDLSVPDFQIDGETYYQWPDGKMRRTPPPEFMRPGYNDLSDDTRPGPVPPRP